MGGIWWEEGEDVLGLIKGVKEKRLISKPSQNKGQESEERHKREPRREPEVQKKESVFIIIGGSASTN